LHSAESLTLTAVPPPGLCFYRWSSYPDANLPQTPTITLAYDQFGYYTDDGWDDHIEIAVVFYYCSPPPPSPSPTPSPTPYPSPSSYPPPYPATWPSR